MDNGLSRLPLEEAQECIPLPGDTVLMMEALSDTESPVITTAIRLWTDRDPDLSEVQHMVLHGWPAGTGVKKEWQPYKQRQLELSVHGGCVLWGSRVVIPTCGRQVVIRMLHEGHPGICRMKSLARSVVWWPGLDADLEAKVSTCEACQANWKSPPKAPLHPWEWPSKPWSRLHVDFAGPFQGKTLFVLVDAHSKWLEASVVASTSSEQAIKALRRVFATHGLPEVLVSDNGTAFTSTEFQTFVKRNGFRHVKTAPYHPASNGLAERAVQTVKEALKKSSGDMEACLIRFLFQYRLTPHSTTGRSPAELLLGRQPRSHLDFMVPERQDKECNNTDRESHVRKNQERQKTGYDQHARYRSFNVGDTVYMLNHRGSPKWISAVVAKCFGPLALVVKFPDGREACYHVDHVKARETRGTVEDGEDCDHFAGEAENDNDQVPKVPIIVEEPAGMLQNRQKNHK